MADHPPLLAAQSLRLRHFGAGGAGAVAALTLAAVCAVAGTAAGRPFEFGFEAMRQGDYEAAVAHFQAAEEHDRPRALFFQGAAMLRQGRFDEALRSLREAQSLGFEHPEVDFELGWALLRSGFHAEAVERLESYESSRPGRGQTSEFLGRAHLALGNHEQARALLEQAIERDEELRETATMYLAMLEEAAGNPDKAFRHFSFFASEPDEAGPASVLRERLGVAPLPPHLLERPAVRRWRLSLSLSGGYNSNVIALGDGVPLPPDISSKSSVFARAELAAALDLLRDRRSRLTLGYGLRADVYESDHRRANLLHQQARLAYAHRLAEGLTGGLAASNAYSVLGGRSFRNEVALEPSLAKRLGEHLAFTGSYRVGYADYFVDVPRARKRDGFSHTLRGALQFQVPGSELRGQGGYYHSWHRTDGRDFQRRTHGLFAALAHPLPFDVTAQASYTRLFSNYDNPNSFTEFTRRRRDRIDLASFRLSRPLFDGLDIFGRYDLTRHRSNIGVFDYRQHVTSAGLAYTF